MTEADEPAARPDDADVVIIGAGVIGCALAHELARRGHRTVNIDKAASAGSGSTSNSCAIVRFSYSTVPGINLAWEGGFYWKHWAEHIGVDDELGLIDYHECGQLLMVAATDTRIARVQALWDELAIPYEFLSLAELSARFPWLDHGIYGPPTRPEDPAFWSEPSATITGALFTPDGGYVSDPQLSCHNLQRGAEANGGRFLFNAQVVAIETDADAVTGVTLADGHTVRAPIVVNVAGPHSSVINKLAGVYDEMNIKTAALRHEVHHVPAPPGIDFESRGVVAADDDIGIYFRPEVGNNVLIGSGDPTCDAREYVDPDDYNRNLTEEQWNVQVLRANRRIPTLGVPHERKGIVDLYDVSDDWLPIYDGTSLDGFYVAIGTSGNQYKNAGVAGQLMADLIEAVEAGHDHDNDPLTTTGRYSGRRLDIGFFSRNRQVNPDSSMSVHG